MASLSRKKKILFALISLVGFPLLLLLALELSLRLLGYGYNPDFFRKESQNGVLYLRDNEAFGRRFFPGDLYRFIVPFKIPAEKSPDTFRIFVLGSSAAMGDPDPSYAISRQLEIILPQAYPDTRFEIINAAMTAINSNVVLEIARDIIANGDPDLLLIYEGNNEVIGPFGPGTVFTGAMQSPTFIRLNYAFKRTKIGQLLASLADSARIKEGGVPEQWGGLEMFVEHEFSLGDPRLERVYANFRDNLHTIASLASDNGIASVLSTVSVNSRDFPPFDSQLPAGRNPAEILKHFADGNFATLQLVCENILQSHPENAFARFMLGQALLKQNRPAEARPHLIKAKDADRLRFRTDSRLNDEVRRLAASLSAENRPVYLADVDAALNNRTPEGLAGYDQFFEHVHFTFQGNYEAAVALLPAIHKAMAAAGKADPSRELPARVASQQECQLSLAYTPWELYLQSLDMAGRLTQAPFTRQPFNQDRITALRREALQAQRRMQLPGAEESVAKWLAKAIELRPDDWMLQRNYAQYNWDEGNFESAIRHFSLALEIIPNETALVENLATLYAEIDRPAEARSFLNQLLIKKRITPRYYLIDGQVSLLEGNLAAAEAAFRKSIDLRLNTAKCLAGLGEVALKRGNTADARLLLEQSRRIEITHENEYLRALIAQKENNPAEARAAIEAALKRKKNLPRYLDLSQSMD